MILEWCRPNSQLKGLSDPDGAVLGDPVGHVYQSDSPERKPSIGHHGEMQGKREHVGISSRQLIAYGESADAAVVDHALTLDVHIREHQLGLGNLATTTAYPRQA
jgi:hypothetical protein